jgi:cytochrome b
MTDASGTVGSDRIARSDQVRVWDPLVRIFHWSLVGLFGFAYFTGDEWGWAHEQAGYVIAGLLAARVVWGLIGSRHARFSDFIYRPATIFAFLKDTLAMKANRYIGHNPAGGAMVVALIMAITAISVSGYMMTMDAFWGAQWVEDAHEISVNLTLLLIALHLAGVALASLEQKENLVRSMFTGLKRRN